MIRYIIRYSGALIFSIATQVFFILFGQILIESESESDSESESHALFIMLQLFAKQ
jgi:hypothetical protein